MFLNHSLTEKELFHFLQSKSPPVLETELLKQFFPPTGKPQLIDKTLIKQHFILYHYLHKLALSLYDSDFLLYIYSIYIYLFKKPEPQYCPFFKEDILEFCNSRKKEDKLYCDHHLNQYNNLLEGAYLILPGIQQYYLNPENYLLLDDEYLDIIEKSEKIKSYAFKSIDLNGHFQTLNLTSKSSLNDVKKQYKKLVKKLHPDLNSSSDSLQQFIEINQAYNTIREIME